MAGKARKEAAPDEVVTVGEFTVYPARPLPEMRSGGNMAYVAEPANGGEGEFCALLCEPTALSRLDLMPLTKRIETPSILSPIAWAAVDWPPTERRHLMVVQERLAGRYVGSLGERVEPLNEEDVLHLFLQRVVPSLRAMHGAGFVHGAIHPLNLFLRDSGRRQFAIGDYVSLRPFVQHAQSYLPVELAMASPGARGYGHAADDVFSLAATMLFLLLGRNPTEGADAAEIMRARIDSGSYPALVGSIELPAWLVELLRGMMADDVKARWTMAEIEQWLPVRQRNFRQGATPKRAPRAFEFAGRPYFTTRALANGFAADPTAAAMTIRGSDFMAWIERAVGDEIDGRLLKNAMAEDPAETRTEARDAALAARVCIALDQLAPIRYRLLRAMPDGLGPALVDAFDGRGSVQHLAEAIAQQVPQFWLTSRPSPAPDQVQLYKNLERIRLLLDDRRLGGGVERLVYELNPNLHCLSPLIEAAYCVNLSELLPALEERAGAEFGGSHPLDRHVAGFLATRLKNTPNEWMSEVSSTNPRTKLIGTIRVLARLQVLGSIATAPNLGRWLAKQATPLVDEFHHRPTRKRIGELLDRAGHAGRLHEMLAVLDNTDRRDWDRRGFAEARRAHARLAEQIRKAQADAEGPRREREVRELAAQMAASFSATLAGVGLLAALLAMA